MMYYLLLGKIRETVFEDGDPPPPPPPPPGAGDPPPPPGAGDPPPLTPPAGDPPPDVKKGFTQEDVNRMLADDRRKHQEQTKKALAELDALRSKAQLTTQERDELDSRYQKMQNELLTKEELAAKEQAKLKKEHESQLKEMVSDRDSWKDRFTTSAIRRSITDAAAKHDAYNPAQIEAILRPVTRLVEDRDDNGQPTGKFKPEVRFEDTNKEGEPVTLTLPPIKAVERMKELPDYLNLFKGTGVGGLGKNNQPSGKKSDPKELAKDPEAYRRARAEGKLNFKT